MKIIKTSNYIKIAEFTSKELAEIGYKLMDWGDYDQDTGAARQSTDAEIQEFGILDEENSYTSVDENFVDTRMIVQLGRLLWGNQGDIRVYAPQEDETRGAIEELQNIISINSTLAQSLDDAEIRDIKILISQVYKIGQILEYWI